MAGAAVDKATEAQGYELTIWKVGKVALAPVREEEGLEEEGGRKSRCRTLDGGYDAGLDRVSGACELGSELSIRIESSLEVDSTLLATELLHSFPGLANKPDLHWNCLNSSPTRIMVILPDLTRVALLRSCY